MQIGIDIIEIARIEKAIDRWGEDFLHRVYTEAELSSFSKHPMSLATRFAGKEAIVKALGTSADRGFRWKEIEILSEPSGKPTVHLHGNAQNQADKLGLSSIAISLSHSREYAIALAAGEAK